jgi:hypothetical protein
MQTPGEVAERLKAAVLLNQSARLALADFTYFICVRPVPFAATQLHLQRSFSKSSSIIRLANVAP